MTTYAGKPTNNTTTALKIKTEPGTTYQLQGTSNSASGTWVNLGDAFLAEKKLTVVSISDYPDYTDFRVLEVPPGPTAPPTLPPALPVAPE